MALPPDQLRECLRATGEFITKRRPPPEIRHKVDIRADIKGSTITLIWLRPAFDDKTRMIEAPFARARWIEKNKVWRLYWMRANSKWDSYDSLPESPSIEALLAEVDRDPHGCFFG